MAYKQGIGRYRMILKILIFVLLLIVISLLLYFLMQIFIPAVSKQIGSSENYFLSKFEHKFEKLENRAQSVKVTAKAFVDSLPPESLSDLKLPSFDGQNCKSVAFALRAVESYKNVCLGYGDCIKSCERKAITLEKSGAVITTLCIGCGKCIHACPKNLINLIPMDSSSFKSERTGKKIEWPDKKGFKIWESCYRIISQK